MNGPEHYREAERHVAQGEQVMDELVAAVKDGSVVEGEVEATTAQVAVLFAGAQVHAMLALAASQTTAEFTVDPTTGGELKTIGRDR